MPALGPPGPPMRNDHGAMTKFSLALFATLSLVPPARAGAFETDLVQLQRDWEVIRYQTPASGRAHGFELLAERAQRMADSHPGSAELLTVEGLIVSSWAEAQGGLRALVLVRRAKALYEEALRIDERVLDGSAYDGLGVLYYRTLPWPLGFADRERAGELLEKALALDPAGLDTNYLYGEYLLETGRPAQAVSYLERAVAAAPRHGRYVADIGRREEARALLEKAHTAH